MRAYARASNPDRATVVHWRVAPWVSHSWHDVIARSPFIAIETAWSDRLLWHPVDQCDDILTLPGRSFPTVTDRPTDHLHHQRHRRQCLQIPATPNCRTETLLAHGARFVAGNVHARRRPTNVDHPRLRAAWNGRALLDQLVSRRPAGFAKVNLDPVDWNDPGDALRFLNDRAGDLHRRSVFAVATCLKMPLQSSSQGDRLRGKAAFAGLRERLSNKPRCLSGHRPVFDERVGPIGVFDR